MSAVLQARGEGLCPVNVSGYTDSLVAFLEREGYTDIRVVSDKPKKREVRDASPSNGSASRRTPVASTRRVVTRRPRT